MPVCWSGRFLSIPHDIDIKRPPSPQAPNSGGPGEGGPCQRKSAFPSKLLRPGGRPGRSASDALLGSRSPAFKRRWPCPGKPPNRARSGAAKAIPRSATREAWKCCASAPQWGGTTRETLSGMMRDHRTCFPDKPGCTPLRHQAMPSLNFSDFSVFCISMVMVMGPTPPGTGVIQPAISLAASKSTSPFKMAIF